MMPVHTGAPARWAHHSWLPSGQPARDERTARGAHAFLFRHYPQLVERRLADLPPELPQWPRPACARLCRVVAALACARSLRRVVAIDAHARFAHSVAPRVLAAIQRHPRGAAADVEIAPSPSLFDRRDMTALGLALLRHVVADPRDAFCWSLCLPREIVHAAARYRVRGLSPAGARALLADARRLMEGRPC